jgi:hypothetical protein
LDLYERIDRLSLMTASLAATASTSG